VKTLRNSIRNCLVLLVILASLAMGQQDEIAKLKDLVDKAKTDKQALRQLQSLAEQGNAGAQSNLGYMYYSGEGVPKDPVEAVKWFRKAADQGDADAQTNLGIMYEGVKGVSRDLAEALKWYRKAADQGNADAQNHLGYYYSRGMYTRGDDLVSEDPAEAVKWFRKAADQGHAAGQTGLGTMYERGKGVSRDLAEAVKWYRKAADQGNALAKKWLASLEVTIAQMLAKEARAKAWQAYSQRPKTTLEQVLNYTSTADVNGLDNKYWISGANGQNKCVLEITNYVYDELKVERIIDIRRLSQVGFRISTDWVGDEKSKIPRTDAAVLERLKKAWGLAFAECPSVEKAPF